LPERDMPTTAIRFDDTNWSINGFIVNFLKFG